jgi:hypothetical protein
VVTQSATVDEFAKLPARDMGRRPTHVTKKKWIDHANALARGDDAELEAPEEGKNDGCERALHGRTVSRSDGAKTAL